MTQIEKEAFFAQYWGQEVLSDLTNMGKRCLYVINERNFYNINKKEVYLQLKSIESITNEDAVKCGFVTAEHFLKVYEKIGVLDQQEADKLRELGYLVGWRNYTTEQLIESGIVKI